MHAKEPTFLDTVIAKRIHELRLYKGFTRKELAVLLKISPQQIYKYELGDNRLTVGRLESFARALNVNITEFLQEDSKLSGTSHTRLLRTVMHNFIKIQDPKQQKVVSLLVRSLVRKK